MASESPKASSTSGTTPVNTTLEDKLQELEFLQRLDRELSWVLDFNYVLDITLDWAIRRTAADAGLIARKRKEKLHIVRVTGQAYKHAAELMREPWPINQGTIGWVADKARPFYMPYVTNTSDRHLIFEHTRSQFTIPIAVKQQVIGVLHLESRHPAHFTQEMRTFVSHVVNRASIALYNAELYVRTYNSEQLKSDMLRMAAHDLRNPLSNVMNGIYVLQRMKEELPATAFDVVQLIDTAARQMHLLIDELLTLERIEAAAADFIQTDIDILAAFEEAVTRIQPFIEEKKQTFTQIKSDKPIMVQGELAYFRQAMMNLLSNASKYTPEGGKITARLEHMGNRIFFEVEDTGFGISKEKQARLFERFYRAKEPGTEHIGGTGLGLSLVRSVIERAKGEVWFKSNAGEGSTFGFWLPVVPPSPQSSKEAETPKEETVTLETVEAVPVQNGVKEAGSDST